MSKKDTEVLELTMDITGEKGKKRGESVNDFSVRMARAVAKIDEDDWDELPQNVQAWFNESALALNDEQMQDVPDFPGLESEEKGKSSGTDRASLNSDKSSTSRRGKRTTERDSDKSSSGEEMDPNDLNEGDGVIITKDGGVVVKGVVTKIGSDRVYVDKGGARATGIKFTAIESVEVTGGAGKKETTKTSDKGRVSKAKSNSIDVEDLKEGDNVTIEKDDGKEITGEVVDVSSRSVIIYDTENEEELRIPKRKIKGVEMGGDSGKGDDDAGAADSLELACVGFLSNTEPQKKLSKTVDDLLDNLDENGFKLTEDQEDAIEAFTNAFYGLQSVG